MTFFDMPGVARGRPGRPPIRSFAPPAPARQCSQNSSASSPATRNTNRWTFPGRRPLAGRHEGCLNDADYDEDLLFVATVLHDLGLGEHAAGEARFEVEGADLAAAVLSAIGEINRTNWGITANMALPTRGVVVGEKIQLVIEVEASPKTQWRIHGSTGSPTARQHDWALHVAR
ncbi:MAG TPA: YceI family protein [Streptosporangiaceae bacterium]|nr:YceI family protein [Streptosporangiaceae bacterium]